ncbi:DUF4232 domain-containing protein [Streptomyces griseus]|uniref:DUF4232 domain-containing protein n=1 Tax=Streptomyces griseus TaxID=1911 RepID=UPI0004C4D3A2|nr:DUF4232 domain-containing protein [Streptomyces griseus]
MRTSHRTTRTALLVAAVAAASLGLTACGGDDTGAKDAGSAKTSQQAAAPQNTDTTPAAGDAATAGGATGSGTAGGTGGSDATPTADQAAAQGSGSGSGADAGPASGSKAGSGSGSGDSKAPVCAYGDVKITAAKADEVPTEHIVLTATNTSGSACRLLGHPLIAFGEIQTAKDVPPVAASKPAAPVVLEPGAPAYANVRISNGGVHEDNKVVKEFNVNLFAADGPAEGSVVVTAPAGGIAVDDAVAKTGYWTPELRNGADEF